jgi:hypothetical protein
MTIVSSTDEFKPPPLEFVFKGKGIRVKVNPPGKVQVQWAEKGSYRLEHVLKYIERLPTIPTALFPAKRVIFTLDDYSAHLPVEVDDALIKKGYFPIKIGGGVTGDIQVNDTTYHRSSKNAYRKREMKMMLEMLKANPAKIPAPSRDQMMEMFSDAWEEVYEQTDSSDAYKKCLINIAFDGSEDHLASKRLMDLVGAEMLVFREELKLSTQPSTMKELRAQIIPPEGVKYKNAPNDFPPDEGFELFQGDGDDLEDADDIPNDSSEEDTHEWEMAMDEDPFRGDPPSNEQDDHEDLKLIRELLDKVTDVRGRCSNALLPHLVKVEGHLKNASRKLAKEATVIDGIIVDALTREEEEEEED